MASPKNYERKQELENDKEIFVWHHKGLGPEVKVVRRYGQSNYDVLIPAHPPDYREARLGRATNKQDARKKAVDWMENNPQGDTFRRDRR